MRYILDWKHTRINEGKWYSFGWTGTHSRGFKSFDALMDVVEKLTLLGKEPVMRAVLLANLRTGREVQAGAYTLKIIEVPDDRE